MEKKISRIGFYWIALLAVFIIATFQLSTVAFAETNLQSNLSEASSFKQERVENFLMQISKLYTNGRPGNGICWKQKKEVTVDVKHNGA